MEVTCYFHLRTCFLSQLSLAVPAVAGVVRQEAREWNASNARAVRYLHSCRPFGSQPII